LEKRLSEKGQGPRPCEEKKFLKRGELEKGGVPFKERCEGGSKAFGGGFIR